MDNEYHGSRYDWMRRAEEKLKREEAQGRPVSDALAHSMLDALRAGQKINETQRAITPFIEKMAPALAEAARSSAEAGHSHPSAARQVGTDPMMCLERWIDVLRKEAQRIIKEQECTPPSGTKSEISTSSSLSSPATSSRPLLEGSANPAPQTASDAIEDASSQLK